MRSFTVVMARLLVGAMAHAIARVEAVDPKDAIMKAVKRVEGMPLPATPDGKWETIAVFEGQMDNLNPESLEQHQEEGRVS